MQRLPKLIFAIALVCFLLACGGGGGGGGGGGTASAPQSPTPSAEAAASPISLTAILPIDPTIQQTNQWCWAASAQMVLGYYKYPFLNPANPQCGIVAMVFGGQCLTDCTRCPVPIGPMLSMNQVIDNYGLELGAYLPAASAPLYSALMYRPLSMAEIQTEISENRPIVIGIAPTGGVAMAGTSEHIAVLVGYDLSNGRTDVIVNDPFPYAPNGFDPYLSTGGIRIGSGQYKLPYLALVQDLAWENTIYQIGYQQLH